MVVNVKLKHIVLYDKNGNKRRRNRKNAARKTSSKKGGLCKETKFGVNSINPRTYCKETTKNRNVWRQIYLTGWP